MAPLLSQPEPGIGMLSITMTPPRGGLSLPDVDLYVEDTSDEEYPVGDPVEVYDGGSGEDDDDSFEALEAIHARLGIDAHVSGPLSTRNSY